MLDYPILKKDPVSMSHYGVSKACPVCPGIEQDHCIPGMLYKATKGPGPGIEQDHCIPGMLYEATKGPGIEQDHCIPGMLYEVTKGFLCPQSFPYENSRRAMNRSPEIWQESDGSVMKNEILRCVRIVEEQYK